MSQEENKNLTNSFKTAAETEQLLKKAADLVQVLKASLKNTNSPLVELPLLSDLSVLEICLETIKNQQRQDKKIAELEKRLADMEDGGKIVKLDKGPRP
jgi:hypothetical protein